MKTLYNEFVASISQEIEAKIDAGIKERLAIEELAQEEAENKPYLLRDFNRRCDWEEGFIVGYIKANEIRLKNLVKEFLQKHGTSQEKE